ncbi:hypothetical protein MmTuc01_1599 [Methanosarcina mazei Tuc01]|uniref:Uncharacterized protein n=1 Tax=Methanosarcina mazei Tuc01 TaxID=1236903 RepID=M1Q3X3_METMZ|nr:hypothetical protein MmTuc01_1599 [Methanosarcina mazei Tuc01]
MSWYSGIFLFIFVIKDRPERIWQHILLLIPNKTYYLYYFFDYLSFDIYT